MNYRHAYHAGNFADVLKHLVLVRVINYLARKDKAFRVIDTHGGIGEYDLAGIEAGKTGEWLQGIGRLLDGDTADHIAARHDPTVVRYLEIIRAFNPVHPASLDHASDLACYPGSPALARHLLRPQDTLLVNELHPEDNATLRQTLARRADTKVMALDGWTALRVSFTTFYTNSFIVVIFAVIGNLMACSLTAYAFARLNFWGRKVWFALMLGTLMLPYHVTLVPQYVMFLNLGWVNTFLPLILPKYLAVDAFFVFLMVQFFRGIPREIDEAAVMDGCGPWRIYWKIMLPLSTPVMATAAIFSFIWTYDDFLGPLLYLNDMRSYTVPLALRGFVDSSGGESLFGELFAMSTLSLVPIFIIFLAFQRMIIRGVAMGALKR